MADDAPIATQIRHVADIHSDLVAAIDDLKAKIEQLRIVQETVKDAHEIVSGLTAEFDASVAKTRGIIGDVEGEAQKVIAWFEKTL